MDAALRRGCPPRGTFPLMPGQEHCFLDEPIRRLPSVWLKPNSNHKKDCENCPDLKLVEVDLLRLGFIAYRGGVDVVVRVLFRQDGTSTVVIQHVVFPYGRFQASGNDGLPGLLPGYGPAFNVYGLGGAPPSIDTWLKCDYEPTTVFTTGLGAQKSLTSWFPMYSWRPLGSKSHLLFTPKPQLLGFDDYPKFQIQKAQEAGMLGSLAHLEVRQPFRYVAASGRAYAATYAFELSALSAPPWAPGALRLEVETNKSSPHGATLAPQRVSDATADYGQLFAGNPFSSSNSWQTSMNGIYYCGLFGSDASHLKSESGWNLLDLASKESKLPHNVSLQTAVRVNELPPQLHGLLWGPGTIRPTVSLVLKLSMWVAA